MMTYLERFTKCTREHPEMFPPGETTDARIIHEDGCAKKPCTCYPEIIMYARIGKFMIDENGAPWELK